MSELLPCPLCGLAPAVGFAGDEDGGYHWIECRCGRESWPDPERFVGVHGASKDEVAAAWNRRAPVQASEARGVPAPNWCPTCGKRPDDPKAMFCSDQFHLRSSAHTQAGPVG